MEQPPVPPPIAKLLRWSVRMRLSLDCSWLGILPRSCRGSSEAAEARPKEEGWARLTSNQLSWYQCNSSRYWRVICRWQYGAEGGGVLRSRAHNTLLVVQPRVAGA